MTARATIKQSDLRRMAMVANDQNVMIEIETAAGKVRVMPNIPVIPAQETVDKRKVFTL